MATRFYFCTPTAAGIAAPVVPLFSVTWTQNGNAGSVNVKRALQRKGFVGPITTLASSNLAPLNAAATEDDGKSMHVSEPLPRQTIGGTISFVMSGLESAATDNISLAVIVRVVSQDGTVERGVLLSNLNVDTELGTTAATRIINAAAVTPLLIEPGDRLVVEIGDHHAAGTTGKASAVFYGTSGASDFALTSGLTTTLNPWIEFSQDLFAALPNNYQFINTGDGISTSGRIR